VLFIPGFARVTYGEVLSTKNQEYVEATRALGAGAPRILFNAILPNIIGPILVQFSLTVAAAIILESGLSFLGLGVVPPAPSWGLMIRGARGYMEQNPMGLLWPCAALVFTIWSINALCDSLRDAIDPRTASTSRGFWRRLREAVAPSQRAATAMPGDAVLSVEGLKTRIVTPNAIVRAVDDVSFAVRRGETLAVVGESGSGKSMTGLSMMGLLPKPGGRIVDGTVQLATKSGRVVDLAKLDEEQLRTIRGEEVAMIFQEPMTSLNPVYRIGAQIVEAIRAHRAVDAAAARQQAHKLLERVGIADPARCLDEYPHQLSGGMRQRAMIALALSCEPVLLIADEPTTALDVTIQAQILDLMRQLQRERPSATAHSMAVIFITHNLGIVAEMADRLIVMYAGQIVEEGAVAAIFEKPHHPYTRGLLESVPRPERGEASEVPARRRLATIPGTVPNLAAPRTGCAFAPRCPLAIDICRHSDPALVDVAPGRRSRCLRWSDV
jgi:peptide/nickel transport system permease protein